MQKEELPNIAMADAFMSIFGYKRVKPTDKELELKYRKRNVDKVVLELDEIQSNKH
jgi:hypothetical protein